MFGSRPSFDEEWYLLAYPDVAEAVAAGEFRDAYDHYRQFGKRESRLAAPPFDENFYLLTNPDVANAVMLGEFESGLDHFIRIGFREGRQPQA